MVKFEIKKLTREIRAKNRDEIKTGCTLDTMWQEPESIMFCESRERAIEELKKEKYKPSCVYYKSTVSFYAVTEYFVEIYEADEDGEFLSGSDYDSYYEFVFDEETDDIKILNN